MTSRRLGLLYWPALEHRRTGRRAIRTPTALEWKCRGTAEYRSAGPADMNGVRAPRWLLEWDLTSMALVVAGSLVTVRVR
jgi:hypothetical protein